MTGGRAGGKHCRRGCRQRALRRLTPGEEKTMETTITRKKTARPTVATEAEVQQLHAELEALKKELSARIMAMEALVPKQAEAAQETVSAETLAMIAVAVTAFLGKKVRIRSAHLTHTVTPWAQAGRAIVQASHNLNR